MTSIATIFPIPNVKAFNNKHSTKSILHRGHTTKYITEPTAIDDLEPVAPQAISTEAIDSLEIDIPSFDHRDGPLRYYILSQRVLHLFPTVVITSL